MLILRENDKGNEIQFIFTDLTGITSADFRLIKPDETFVITNGAIDGNTVTFTVTEQMCAIPGKARFNIRLYSNDTNIYTYVSRCLIDINLDLEDAIESTAEVNGLVFPDDFLTETDLGQYATKEYVDDAIAAVPVYTPPGYSLTEQDTGLKWIDGKPIYQKSYHITELTEKAEGEYDISNDNADMVISCYGVIKVGTWGGNKWYTVPRIGDNFYFTSISASSTSITIVAKQYNFTEAYVTLRYTKTTDTV